MKRRARARLLLVASLFAIVAGCSSFGSNGASSTDDPDATAPPGSDGGGGGDGPTGDDVLTGHDGPTVKSDSGADASGSSRRVFISTKVYDGNLGGVAAADAQCNMLAAAKSMPGNYRAWISGSALNPAMSVVARFSKPTVPYVRVDGVQIASGWADLIAKGPQKAIVITEDGADLTMNDPFVWTATTTAGAASAGSDSTCNDWTASTAVPSGAIGAGKQTGTQWTVNGTNTCEKLYHLYCFEQ